VAAKTIESCQAAFITPGGDCKRAQRLGKRKTGDYVGPFSFQPYKMREYVGLIPKVFAFGF